MSAFHGKGTDWHSIYGAIGTFPIGRHIDSPLNDSNIAQAIRNAYRAARDEGGGRVIIPRNSWNMGVDGGLDLAGYGYTNRVWIEGVPGTQLIFPAPWTGEMCRLRGSGAGMQPWSGGIRDIDFIVDQSNFSSTGKGVVLDACAGAEFERIGISQINGGSSWYCRDFQGGGNNSQDILFKRCNGQAGNINYDLQQLTSSTMIGCGAIGAVSKEFALSSCQFEWYGGSMQGNTATIFVELLPAGANHVMFSGTYHEGGTSQTTMFKCGAASAQNFLSVERFWLNASPGIFLDMDNHSEVNLQVIAGAQNASTIVKMRGTANALSMTNAGSPLVTPSQFDIPAPQRANVWIQSYGSLLVGATNVMTGLPW